MNPILSKQIVKDNQTIVVKISQQVSYLMEDTVNYAKGIVVSDQVQTLLKKMSVTQGYDYYVINLQLETILKEHSLLRDKTIVDMVVVDNHNKVLEMNDLYSSYLKEDWYNDFRYNEVYNGVSKRHVVSNHANTSRLDVVTYVMNIYDKQNANVYLGKLLIHLDYHVLVKPMLIDPSLGMKILTFDKDQNVVYAPEDETVDAIPAEIISKPQISEKAMYKDGQYYIMESFPIYQWKLYGIISENKINANMKYINYVLLSIIMICLFIMSIIIYPVVTNVTKPLMKLIRGMRQVSKGELHTHIAVTSGDEIEEVAQVFNKMVEDIKILVDESVFMEKKKRELELKMFMYQINPHFIYNTLNSVIYLARKADAPDIAALTKAFISFLQRTIKTQPETLSSIQDEIKYIEDYTKILTFRYNDRVEVIWDVDESCRAYKIPRMILYPLVENSIFHGLLPVSEKGWIKIRITLEYGALSVSVEDNGVGIHNQQLEKLRDQMSSLSLHEDLDHIGLLNVNNRLKLLYGDTSILNIASVLNEGTRIYFMIPSSLADPSK
ncbi:sensor histidine kinase [Paenibacillus agricola]|uniref:sensor histidine kinase n=1 Tax=Paenibacillus agricola TaxID=2716264 RepID=UPI001A9E7B56|nr:histidine kinase [Paenibacillus agricola]